MPSTAIIDTNTTNMASTTTINKSEDCQRQYFHCPKALQDPIEIVLK